MVLNAPRTIEEINQNPIGKLDSDSEKEVNPIYICWLGIRFCFEFLRKVVGCSSLTESRVGLSSAIEGKRGLLISSEEILSI